MHEPFELFADILLKSRKDLKYFTLNAQEHSHPICKKISYFTISKVTLIIIPYHFTIHSTSHFLFLHTTH